MKKIIVTGFEPFGSYVFNPTKDLACFYNRKNISGIEIVGIVLPCSYYGAFEILSNYIDKINPYAVISTGLSSKIKKLRIEKQFTNVMYHEQYVDCDGFRPENLPIDNKILSGLSLYANSNSLKLKILLSLSNLPIETSDDAGSFICNSLGYLTTKKIIGSGLSIKNLFIHTPWTDDFESKVQLESGKIFLEKESLYDSMDLLIKNI